MMKKRFLKNLITRSLNKPTDTEPHKRVPIIMAHGIFDSGEDFGTLKNSLKAEGYKCLSPSLEPANGSLGLTNLTENLASYIAKHLGEKVPFHLLGYSMGGIVARNYLKLYENRSYCDSLTTLASPHHGTTLAHLYPKQAGIELRPNSDFLNVLNESELSYHSKTLSIRTKYDGIIIPSTSSELKHATNLCFTSPSHLSLLLNSKVRKAIIAHLQKTEECTLATS